MEERSIHNCQYIPVRTNIYQYAPIRTNTTSIHNNTYQIVPILTNTYQYIPIRANTCQGTLNLRPWMANRMQRSPDSRPDVPNITANDEIRKLNSMQLSLSTIKWRRRPALHAHLVHELFDVGQCFYSLLLHSSHRRLDGMGPVYPARARAQKSNKYFASADIEKIYLLLGRVIHSEFKRCL